LKFQVVKLNSVTEPSHIAIIIIYTAQRILFLTRVHKRSRNSHLADEDFPLSWSRL